MPLGHTPMFLFIAIVLAALVLLGLWSVYTEPQISMRFCPPPRRRRRPHVALRPPVRSGVTAPQTTARLARTWRQPRRTRSYLRAG